MQWGQGNHSVKQTLALSHSALSVAFTEAVGCHPRKIKADDTHALRITSAVEEKCTRASHSPAYLALLPTSKSVTSSREAGFLQKGWEGRGYWCRPPVLHYLSVAPLS